MFLFFFICYTYKVIATNDHFPYDLDDAGGYIGYFYRLNYKYLAVFIVIYWALMSL